MAPVTLGDSFGRLATATCRTGPPRRTISAKSSSENTGENSGSAWRCSRHRAPVVGHVARQQRRVLQRHRQGAAHQLGGVAGHHPQDALGFLALFIGQIGAVDVPAKAMRHNRALVCRRALTRVRMSVSVNAARVVAIVPCPPPPDGSSISRLSMAPLGLMIACGGRLSLTTSRNPGTTPATL